MPKCESCGRFMRCAPGASWAMRFSGYPMTPDHEEFRCVACTKHLGPLTVQHGIRPDNAGIFSQQEP